MIRVVADTNMLIASIFWNGAPYRIITSALDHKIEIISSPEILNEVRKVLKQEFRLSEQETDDIVNCIMSYTTIIEPKIKVKVVRDPKDDMLIEAALDSGSHYIITRDKDLLVLKQYQGIKMVKPEEFEVNGV